MTLALALTTDDMGAVTLDITDAAHAGTAVYTSNFATVDSWAGGTTGAHTAPTVSASGSVLNCGTLEYSDQYVKRTVTGLTIGVSYRVAAVAFSGGHGGPARVGIAGIGQSALVSVGVGFTGHTTLTYDFVATATSHDIRVRVGGLDEGLLPPTSLKLASVLVSTITAGYGPLQIQRTDLNGTLFVRLPVDVEPDATGALTVIDYEAALTGIVTYVVRDGLGATVSSYLSYGSGGAVPSGCLVAAGLSTIYQVDILEEYDETRTYQALTIDPRAVIGREDFTAVVTGDYGWSKRAGRLRFRLYAPDQGSDVMWQQAQEIAAIYTAGRVVLLRQQTYTGLDLYHVAKAVRVIPADVIAAYVIGSARTWALEVDYVETGWPAGDLVGIDWTYADVATAYLAYWNLPEAFATYDDLKAGI